MATERADDSRREISEETTILKRGGPQVAPASLPASDEPPRCYLPKSSAPDKVTTSSDGVGSCPRASAALGDDSGRRMPAGTPALAVAMSGGVDSSTAAAILARRGEAIIRLTMKLWNHRRLPELVGDGPVAAPVLLARRCV